ncbi:MAG: tyrosine--tRNA ligase, partial [Thermoproteota archaeon]
NQKTNERKVYQNFHELEEAYRKGEIHPLDLKSFVATKLIEILKPAIKYFKNEGSKYIEEMNEILKKS